MKADLTLDWEQAVLQRIEQAAKSPFLLIDDPDNILGEQVLSGVIERGWQVTSLTDPFELRFDYEDQIRRGPLDQAERIIFVIRFPFKDVPFDIHQDADSLHLSLKLFFPSLSYTVLLGVPTSWYPVIYNNQPTEQSNEVPLTEFETAKFVIQVCLGLNYSLNPSLVDILVLLANIARHKLELPAPIKSALLSQISDSSSVKFARYIDTPGKAVQFLQKVWQGYTHSMLVKKTAIAEILSDDVAEAVVVLDTNREFQTQLTALIAESILRPAEINNPRFIPAWMRSGIHYNDDGMPALLESFDYLRSVLPGENTSFNQWVEFAYRWAEWLLSYHQIPQAAPEIQDRLQEFKARLDRTYYSWLEREYPSLIVQPYLPAPTCMHHVLNHIVSVFAPSATRPVALVVVDGMAIQDWLIILSELQKVNPTSSIESSGILALVPTLTSVSRQAMLSGRLPRYFEKNWLNTNAEETYWRSFWEEKGYPVKAVAYIRGLGGKGAAETSEFGLEASIEEVLNRPHIAAAALIVNTVDDLVHSSILGEVDFYQRLRYWAVDQGYLKALVSRLLQQFETIIITSDHGHVSGQGIGDLSFGSIAEERALRARIFHSHTFEKLAGELQGTTLWQNTGLPKEAAVILPKGRGLFTKIGTSGISHGGASIEETIVPYITFTK